MAVRWGDPLDRLVLKHFPMEGRKFTRILFVTNMDTDPKFNKPIQEESELIRGILNTRLPTTLSFIQSSTELEQALAPFDPKDTLIFNWAEDIPGYVEGGAEAISIVESRGFAHTASPRATQVLVFDRAATFRKLRGVNIPAPDHLEVFSPPDVSLWDGKWPALIRPNAEHGSRGLTLAKNPKDGQKAVAEIFKKYNPPAIIVQYISPAREFSVPLWSDGATIETLPIIERDFSKQDGDDIEGEADKAPGTDTTLEGQISPPKNLPKSVEAKLNEQSIVAFREFGIKIYGRVDWRLAKGSLNPIAIDVNPEPDISSDSTMIGSVINGLKKDHKYLILGILDRALRYYSAKKA